MSELETLINENIVKFRKKIAEDEKLRNELEGITRKVNVDVKDKEGYSFILDNKDIKDFKPGKLAEAEITITATEEDFVALFKKELGPMKAWATRRLKLKASLDDVARLRKFLS